MGDTLDTNNSALLRLPRHSPAGISIQAASEPRPVDGDARRSVVIASATNIRHRENGAREARGTPRSGRPRVIIAAVVAEDAEASGCQDSRDVRARVTSVKASAGALTLRGRERPFGHG